MEHITDGEFVTLPDLKVRTVVRRCNLQHTRAESHVDRSIANDRNLFAREGAPNVFTNQMLVTLVVGVHRHRRIARDGFRTCCGNFEEGVRKFGDFVTHLIDEAFGWLHDDFFVGKSGQRNGAPIDHALAAVNITAFVERHKRLQDGAGIIGVEGVDGTIPVTRSSEFA